MPAFDAIVRDLADAGWELLQAQPRSSTHLLVQVRSRSSHPAIHVPGQWHADAGLSLQPDGQDRKLPALAALLAVPGVELIAHRPGRRAVVRVPHTACPDHYVKVMRRGRAAGAAATLRHLADHALPVPRVLSATEETLTLEALPGRTLHRLLDAPLTTADLTAVGALVRRLHDTPAPAGSPAHTVEDEIAVTERALALARGFDLDMPDPPTVVEVAEALRRVPPSPSVVPLHRDLHDKQLLRADDGSWSILDLDLLALGDPALDLANFRVHLELRAAQGLLDPTRVEPWSAAFLDGYDADGRTRSAIEAYAAIARLRLAAVYAFRPAGG